MYPFANNQVSSGTIQKVSDCRARHLRFCDIIHKMCLLWRCHHSEIELCLSSQNNINNLSSNRNMYNHMIIEKGTFENKNFSNHPLASKEYINCMFNNIIFSGANLTNCIFVDCTFNMCNFSNTDIDHCGFQEVSFIGCKLLSLSFYKVRPFLFSFNFND